MTRFIRRQGTCSFNCCDEEGISLGAACIQLTPAEIPFSIQQLKIQEPCPSFSDGQPRVMKYGFNCIFLLLLHKDEGERQDNDIISDGIKEGSQHRNKKGGLNINSYGEIEILDSGKFSKDI